MKKDETERNIRELEDLHAEQGNQRKMRAVYLQNSASNSPRHILNKYHEMKTMQQKFLTTNNHTTPFIAHQQQTFHGKPLNVFKMRKKSNEKIKMEAQKMLNDANFTYGDPKT